MSLFDYLSKSRRQARREQREREAEERAFEENGARAIHNFYDTLEEMSYRAQHVKGHESPGASAFSGIAPDCIDEVEKWRNSVGDGLTGQALDRVEESLKGDFETLRNFYNTVEAESNDIQDRTLAKFADFLSEIIYELTSQPEPEPEPEDFTEEVTEAAQPGGHWWTRLFKNIFRR